MICDHEPCRRTFAPRIGHQRFCSIWCRRRAWLAAHPRPTEPPECPPGRFSPPIRTNSDTDATEASGKPSTEASHA